MQLWEILLAVEALETQAHTLAAVLHSEMERRDEHWAARQAELETAIAASEGPF
ncbi:MAG TPA: hypothetical protein VMQ86_25620 [Bryobacteraceae bacterium]|jgi:hypothetical protein|nr:hypothetical protein [Bryobacteraceae bacterium]